jgi:hypothetical protein
MAKKLILYGVAVLCALAALAAVAALVIGSHAGP